MSLRSQARSPSQPKPQTRLHRHAVRFNDDEWAAVQDRAQAAGYGPGQVACYIRAAALRDEAAAIVGYLPAGLVDELLGEIASRNSALAMQAEHWRLRLAGMLPEVGCPADAEQAPPIVETGTFNGSAATS